MFSLRKFYRWMFIGLRHRSRWLLLVTTWCSLMLLALSWSREVQRALEPPPPPDQDLQHFRRSTDLKHYLDNIQVLVEPSSPCPQDPQDVPLILVTSTPTHAQQRGVIRSTWGRHQPTYFVLGVEEGVADEDMVDNYVEAKENGDMIIYDMPDHYQNLTLKTVLMLKWTLANCPQARWLFKTDDDVLVNPWTLREVIEEHSEDKLVGYRITESRLHRDEYTKWYVPRWLHNDDVIPEYLSGTGYLIQGKYIQSILDTAMTTPLMNLEDVYLTYLVSAERLQYLLVHEPRLSPYKPWLPFSCGHWALASSHSHTPEGIAHAWGKIEKIASQDGTCDFYNIWICRSCFK